tara:strand:- start:4844 stop:5353 length:510 start_codon:yes stop_codon:yes gene_type:complete
MAYLIFNKGDNSGIYRIAANQDVLDANKGFHNEHMDVVDISDSDFNNFKHRITDFVSRDGDSITWKTYNPGIKFHTRAELQKHIEEVVEHINSWLNLSNNHSKPMASSVETYRDYIRSMDINSIITDPSDSATYDFTTETWSDGTPLNSSLEKYVTDQGQTSYNIFELL